jgi:hypothetical protein
VAGDRCRYHSPLPGVPPHPQAVFDFRVAHGKIVSIEVVADPERLGQLELEVLS